VKEYDRHWGFPTGRKITRTGIEADDRKRESPLRYYDPIYTLPETGQNFWRAGSAQQTLSK